MPLQSIYSLALDQDLEFGQGLMQAVATLQNQTFVQVGCAGGGWGAGAAGCAGRPRLTACAPSP